MKKICQTILINFAVLCTLISGLEIGFQLVYYLKQGHFVFEYCGSRHGTASEKIFERHPYLVGRPRNNIEIKDKSHITVKTSSRHTRWTGAPDNDSRLIRIAVLGGSTTFGTKVDDRDSWPAILQAKLGKKFSVINYGVPGYSTAEAIIQMALVVPDADPHIVVFYQGWNDIHNYHNPSFESDYYQHGMSQHTTLAIPACKEKTALEKFSEVSMIVRLAQKIKTKMFSRARKNALNELKETPDRLVDELYVRNLKTLRCLSKKVAGYSFFVPQVINKERFRQKEGSHWWSPFVKNSAMPELMDRFNLLMKSICPPNDSQCIFVHDILSVQWDSEDFLDFGHFSKSGGEKFASILAERILTKLEEGHPYGLMKQEAQPVLP